MVILFSTHASGKSILNSFKEACEAAGWIGVGCDVFRNGSDSAAMEKLFGELLPAIEKSVPHDPERLYMGGMSGGSARALHYTAMFDRPWKGVISCGGWLEKKFELDYRKGMAVAWVNGDKDSNANAWVEGDSAVLKKRGCKTKLFVFPGGHVIAPADTITEAMRWAEENSK
jgi:predicted esterase